jgi:hypothetical protein
VIGLAGLVGSTQKLAEGLGQKEFAQVLAGWKSGLDALKTKLASLPGITSSKDRLANG